MANPTRIAKVIYDYAEGDLSKVAAVGEARDALVTGGAMTKGGLNMIASASKNGVSYAVLSGLSPTEQLLVLNIALKCLNAGTRPATHSVGRF